MINTSLSSSNNTLEYVKIFLSFLKKVKNQGKDSEGNSILYIGDMKLKSILVQAIVFELDDEHIVIDDGTHQVTVSNNQEEFHFKVGQYLQLMMDLFIDDEGCLYPEITRVLDLSNNPIRESLWVYEVVHIYQKCYCKLINPAIIGKKKNNINGGKEVKKEKVIELDEELEEADLEIFNEDHDLNRDIDYQLIEEEESTYLEEQSQHIIDDTDYSIYENSRMDDGDSLFFNESIEDNENKDISISDNIEEYENEDEQLLSFSSNKRPKVTTSKDYDDDSVKKDEKIEEQEVEEEINNISNNNSIEEIVQDSIEDDWY